MDAWLHGCTRAWSAGERGEGRGERAGERGEGRGERGAEENEQHATHERTSIGLEEVEEACQRSWAVQVPVVFSVDMRELSIISVARAVMSVSRTRAPCKPSESSCNTGAVFPPTKARRAQSVSASAILPNASAQTTALPMRRQTRARNAADTRLAKFPQAGHGRQRS